MADSGTFTKGGRIWRYATSPSGDLKGIYYETNQAEYDRVRNKTYTIYTNPGGSTAPVSQQITEDVTGERYTGVENGKYYVQVSYYEKQSDGTWNYLPVPPGLETANGNLTQAQEIGNDNNLKQQITSTPPPNTSPTDPNQPGAPGGSTPTDPNTPETDPKSPSSGVLVYPLSRPDTLDYLQVTSIKYVSGGLPGTGTFATTPVGKRMTERGTTIWLPMQPSISDNNAVSWNQDELNPFQARVASAAYNAIQNLGATQFKQALTQFAGDVKDFAQDVASASGLPNYVRAYFAGQAAGGVNLIGRQTGAVLNNNLELLFQGPTLRTFQYNYRFTPRDPDESIVVKNIIKTLKTEMSIDRTGNQLFLTSPNVFELKYFFGRTKEQHPFLNKIKLCALTNLSVDYTPDGSYMTFEDGSMTSYNVSMQFSELEPIYKEDQIEASSVMGY